ncbi:MAG: hypothetical protein P8J27_10915, partial [Mariniblastus sp.]|nr:hypothetical protein [Mariniblastus sp.]
MKKLTLLSAFVIALVFSPCVNADLALRFSLDGTSFSDTFNMNVGDSLTVQVYALEIGETRLSDSGL